MSQPLLRPARADDRAALVHLLEATFRSTWEPALKPEAVAAFWESSRVTDYVYPSYERFIVAELDGRVAGMVHWESDFLHALHVDPRLAGQGIGSALLEHAEAAMRAAGVKLVQLETDTFNTNARGFYAAHGYSEAAQYPDEEWGSELMTVLMVKPL